MYAIFDIDTQEVVCSDESMRTPKLAWDFFRTKCWPELQASYEDVELNWEKGEHRGLFTCRLVGVRAPQSRVAGHALQTFNAGEVVRGQCACGTWTQQGATVGEVEGLHRKHLGAIGVDLTPRAAENLPAKERVAKSLNKLKEAGGGRKTFRLPKPALEELDRMVTQENFRDPTAALTSLLMTRSVPAPDESAALYALHIDDPEVEQVVDEAVSLLCRELDSLFPGAAPDGGRGISSNFQGLMVEHVKAMLTGKNQARRSHHTHLPVLLADDNVFGQPFELPKVQGAGYVVVSPKSNEVLNGYNDRFVRAYRGREGTGHFARMVPVFNPDVGGLLQEDADTREYEGVELHFQYEPDILFTTHEGAVKSALKALQTDGESPSSMPLKIVAAVYSGEKNCYVMYGR